MDIHKVFTDINKIFNSIDFKDLNVSTREAFIIPILKELQEQSFKEGIKQSKIDIINQIRKEL